VRLCRLCNVRPVSPSRMKAQDYRCSRCRNATPAHVNATRRYRTAAKGHAANTHCNQRRIWVGRQYHSRAVTVELAAVVNATIKERMCRFRETQDKSAN
jgi:hypothetical protein